MSNSVSTAMNNKQDKHVNPNVPPASKRQAAFESGTKNLLDEARQVVENSVQQGQELNPLIYQMLGLKPTYTDYSEDVGAAQQQMDAAQQQWNQTKEAISQLSAIPKKKRSKDQNKQLRQLVKQRKASDRALNAAREAHGNLATMPKRITGFERANPDEIPAESPFSPQNPLHQAQATESQRLNQYLAGGEVDPTLKHQYDQAEATLRETLAQRFGPDYESSSVGQMALNNFDRQKNEAFATWNQSMVEKYNNLAFQGQANLQNLLGGQIGLMREPSNAAMSAGSNLANLAGARLQQQQEEDRMRLGRAGVTTSGAGFSPMGAAAMGAGGLGTLLTMPTGNDAAGNPISLGGRAWDATKAGAGAAWEGAKAAGGAIASGAGALGNWLWGA